MVRPARIVQPQAVVMQCGADGLLRDPNDMYGGGLAL
jgi:hypothetical protein